jgi:hypothetical protein
LRDFSTASISDRRTAQLRFRIAELAKAVGHSTRSLTTYLDELDRTGVGAVYRASNQHELGRVEILDRFWPYHKESGDSTTDPEQAQYVARVRQWYLEQACVTSAFGAADEKLAGEWYRSGTSLDVVGRAFLLGCARKYVALFNNEGGTPVTSLHYFSGIVQEAAARELNLNYWRYLSARVKKMDARWRAQWRRRPDRRFTAHNLVDKARLGFQRLPHVRVEFGWWSAMAARHTVRRRQARAQCTRER